MEQLELTELTEQCKEIVNGIYEVDSHIENLKEKMKNLKATRKIMELQLHRIISGKESEDEIED
jgi:hypothetical protein